MGTINNEPSEGQPKKRQQRNTPRAKEQPNILQKAEKVTKTWAKLITSIAGIVFSCVLVVQMIRGCNGSTNGTIKMPGRGELTFNKSSINLPSSPDPKQIYPAGTLESKEQLKLDAEYPAAIRAIYFCNPDTDTQASKRTANDVLSDLGMPEKYQDAPRSWCLRAEASSLLCKALLTELRDKLGASYGVISKNASEFKEISEVIKQGIFAAAQIKDYWPALEIELRSAELWRLAGDFNQSNVAIMQARSYFEKLSRYDLFKWFRSFVPNESNKPQTKSTFTFRGETISISAKPDAVLLAAADAEMKNIDADMCFGKAELFFEILQHTENPRDVSKLL